MRKNKRLKDALSILRGQVSPAQYTQIYAGIAVIQEKASSEQLTAIKKSIYTEQIGFVIDSVLESIVTPQVSDFLPRIYSSIDWRVLSSFVDSVFKLKLPDTASNQLGFVYESYLYQFLYNSGSEYFTPSCILNLIFDILPPHDGDIIYDPCCSTGNVFIEASKRADILAIGQEINQASYNLAQINAFIHDINLDIGSKPADTLYHDLHTGKLADLVISNPPFNQKNVLHVKGVKNLNFDWLYVMLAHLKDSGRMASVLTLGSLSSVNHNEREMRKHLVEQGFIDIIITLDKDNYFSTNIPCSIWFLSKKPSKEVLFIHSPAPMQSAKIVSAATRFLHGEAMNEHGFCAAVSLNEIAAKNYSLSPSLYIQDEQKTSSSTHVHTYKLGELAKFRCGRCKTKTSSGTYPVYSAAGQYRRTNTPELEGPAVIIGRKYGIGNTYFEPDNFSASETVFYSTQFSDAVLPVYLYAKLKSIDWNVCNTGTSVPSLNLKTVNNIEISIPDISLQEERVKPFLLLEKKIAQNEEFIHSISNQIREMYHTFCCDKTFPSCRLGDIFRIMIGKTYKTAGSSPWFSIRELDAPYLLHPKMRHITDSKKIIPADTVVVSYKLAQGRVAITTESCTTNEAIAAFLTDRNDMNEYLYCWLKDLNFRQFGSNSCLGDSMRISTLRNIDFPLPSNDEIAIFHAKAKPLFDWIKQLLTENKQSEDMMIELLKTL